MKIVLYTRRDCSYCEKAKELLRTEVRFYFEYIVGESVSREYVLAVIGADFDAKVSLPVVVIDGQYIGGYNELLEYLMNKNIEREELIKSLKNGVLSVTFTKVDGTERVMQCTLMDEHLPERTEKETSKSSTAPGQIVVWDMEKEGFRSFYYDKVKTWKTIQ